MEERILSAVCIIENQAGEILLLKRHPHDRTLPDVYCLAGGKVESCELGRDACVREVKEETNLDVTIISYITTLSNAKFDIQFYYGICQNFSELKISEEHESYLFAKPSELKNLKLGELTQQVLLTVYSNRIKYETSGTRT